MNILQDLLTNYSLEALIILIISILVSIKFIYEIGKWCYDKLSQYFNGKANEVAQQEIITSSIDNVAKVVSELDINIKNLQEQNQEISEQMSNLANDLTSVKESVDIVHKRTNDLNEQMKLTTARLQESTRNYIIDKHHYFCYKVKAIDNYSLSNLERRYQYYREAGGNSFITMLMNELRALPRLTYDNPTDNAVVISKKEEGSNGARITKSNVEP